MPNDKPSPRSKPPGQSGISVSPQELASRVEALEKFIKDNFDERNLWNAQVREWVGKVVVVRLMHATLHHVVGTLRWVDRYTLCLAEQDGELIVVHKGAIATIQLQRG